MPHVPVNDYPWQGEFPDTPNWSENFLLAGQDPKAGVGFWLHCGRWRKDLEMFRETVLVRLPDGTVAASRAIGNANSSPEGPGGPHYAIRIVEPGSKLTYRYNGGVRRIPSEQMKRELVPEGSRTPMKFDLAFESNADVWDLHKVGGSQDFLPAGHIEQIGRVTGTFTVGGEVFEIDTIANRDHSLGPRDNKELKNHQWHQGYFENGISFLVFDAVVRTGDRVVFSEAAVYEGDKLYEAELELPWRCEDAARDHDPVRFKLHYANGTLDIETTEYMSDSYGSLTSPNDQYVGVYQSDGEPTLVLAEQSVRLMLNGSVPGYGCFERTINGRVIPEE
ncbi:hypothetical protein GCM10011371_03420 [Novosphingobium marinum]|uniref:Uncharacterized protein n=1 Tax=Novosphingobium marinum TaxID=1514948 RepID=A0A7Y9XT20_9SPHN|nr:hypothetical protein [Novosphingobium marinum]NYH94034.1 hypothetical protein [Novosphingobium marinum]GGC19108.1 hypothetical protein GCM10011371_03420 [Novosphingobium marinum]